MQFSALAFKAKTMIKAVSKANDQAPNCRVYAAGVRIGAARSAISKTGKSYLPLRLDDPSFANPIHCRLIELEDEGQTRFWSR